MLSTQPRIIGRDADVAGRRRVGAPIKQKRRYQRVRYRRMKLRPAALRASSFVSLRGASPKLKNKHQLRARGSNA